MSKSAAESCLPEPGPLRPFINPNRCEGKEDCLRVCPYDVFIIRKATDEEKARLNPLSRLKLFVHGGQQAFVEHPDQCHSCGLCVSACPEKAITLRREA